MIEEMAMLSIAMLNTPVRRKKRVRCNHANNDIVRVAFIFHSRKLTNEFKSSHFKPKPEYRIINWKFPYGKLEIKFYTDNL